MPEPTSFAVPHLQLFDFFPRATADALLRYTLENRNRFVAATVNKGVNESRNEVVPKERAAATLRDLGPIEPMVRPHLLEVLERVTASVGTRLPSSIELELELSAYGDGAHYAAHRDIPIGDDRVPFSQIRGMDRILSAVCYFHALPKRFSGGQLRLYRFGRGQQQTAAEKPNYVDVEPLYNSFVAFPSWITHEVRHVSCPTKNFYDFRFALNCWYVASIDRAKI